MNNNANLALLLLPATLPVCAAAAGLEPDIERQLSLEGLLELPFVDIATGYAVPLESAPSVASVITAEDIAAMGALTLDQVLESVPGLHAMPSNLTSSSVFPIRGLYTHQNPQVLLLLNGHRISSEVYSSIFPSSGVINLKNVSRIEVIRGPGSAVYGADAFSGVVNIVTRSPKELDGLHLGARSGSFATRNAWAQFGGRVGGNWRVGLALEYMQQAADDSRTIEQDTQTGLDVAFGTSASLAPSYFDRRYRSTTYNLQLANDRWKLALDGWAQRDIGQGAGIARALDHDGYADFDQQLLSLEYHDAALLKDLDFTAQASYQRIDLQYHLNIFPPGNVSLIGDDGNLFTPPGTPVQFPDGVIGNPGRESEVPQLDLVFLYGGLLDHTLRLNLGGREERLTISESKNFGPGVIDGSEPVVDGTLTDVTRTPYAYAPNEERTVAYLSLQDVWTFAPEWTLTTGVRHDRYSDFGSTTNPRVSLVWQPTPELTTKLLYGRAFRAPSFAELYARNNPVVLGNPDLDPETIDTYELAFAYHPAPNLRGGLNVYQYRAHDMIDFAPNPDGTQTAQNHSELSGRGLEAELEWAPTKTWRLRANYAYQETVDEESDAPLGYVPKRQFYVDARWDFASDWQLAAQLNWVGERERRPGDARDDLEDYTLVDATLRRRALAEHWEIAATVHNLFDEETREPAPAAIPGDYPGGGRAGFIEVWYHF